MRHDTNLLMLSGEVTSLTETSGKSKKISLTLATYVGSSIFLFPVELANTVASQFYDSEDKLTLNQGDKLVLSARLENNEAGDVVIGKIQGAEKMLEQFSTLNSPSTKSAWTEIPQV